MLLRFEVDACALPLTEKQTEDADLSDLLSSLSVNDRERRPPISEPARTQAVEDGIRIVRAGELVPQTSILEIKSRWLFCGHPLNWDHYLRQMALSHTPRVIVGIHQDDGEYQEIRQCALQDADTTQHGENHSRRIVMLRRLLDDIIVFARGRGTGAKLALAYRGGNYRELRFYDRSAGGSCLPEKWMKKFDT